MTHPPVDPGFLPADALPPHVVIVLLILNALPFVTAAIAALILKGKS